MSKFTFDDFRVMMREYEQLSDKVPIHYFEARNAWKEVRGILKEHKDKYHEVPRSINATIKWFFQYRETARNGRKRMAEIQSLVEAAIEFKSKQDIVEESHDCCGHDHSKEDSGCSSGDCGDSCNKECKDECTKEVCDGECEKCEND